MEKLQRKNRAGTIEYWCGYASTRSPMVKKYQPELYGKKGKFKETRDGRIIEVKELSYEKRLPE